MSTPETGQAAEVICRATHPTRWEYRATSSPCSECEVGGAAVVRYVRGREDRARVRAVAAVQEAALAIVKRACDVECKSPGKHTGCSSHEPYRALAALSSSPGGEA